jgi:putative cell wall-binding protein
MRHAMAVRAIAGATAIFGVAFGAVVAGAGNAVALGFIFNQALTSVTNVHPGASGAAVASYQIDTTNSFAISDTIDLKIEGVADPTTTNAAVGFAAAPTVTVTGPTSGAFGAGVVGDTVDDRLPTVTTALASSAGAAALLGVRNEFVITLTDSSTGAANDHYTFTVAGIAFNVGSAVVPGNLNLHAYTGDGTGSLATAVTVATVTNTVVVRLAGTDRFATAVAVSNAEFPTSGGAAAVVLARADNYPDALVGATLASARSAPLLFTSGSVLNPATQAEIQRVLPSGRTVFLLGGTAAIPESVATTLTGLGFIVTRYFGADRYGTALAVADALGDPTTVLLATGTNFPDALAAAPAAAHAAGVVLLTDGTMLPASVSAYLAAHPGKVYAIGGPAVIADPSASSLVGSDRYATATAVAAQFFAAPAAIGVASGVTFADALAGGSLLAHSAGPILLSDSNALWSVTSSYLTVHKAAITAAWVLGGTSALSTFVQTEVGTALGQ